MIRGTSHRTVKASFVVISQDFCLIELQACCLKAIRKLVRIPEQIIQDFALAVEEAVLNAHEHGNLELESAWKNQTCAMTGLSKFEIIKQVRLALPIFSGRRIQIELGLTGPILWCSIEDDGAGYPVETACESASEENYGRGLMIINALVDEVKLNKKGNQITIMKKIGG